MMPDPINMVAKILLRMRPPALPADGTEGCAKPPPAGDPVHTLPPLRIEGAEQTYRLRPSDAGWKTPVLILPKRGVLKVGLPLPGERLTLYHPISAQSGTELIPLPSPAASQGELWLVRLPEQQYLLLWMPLGIPPLPLNHLRLSLCANDIGSAAPNHHRHAAWVKYCLRAGIILLFILCAMLALF